MKATTLVTMKMKTLLHGAAPLLLVMSGFAGLAGLTACDGGARMGNANSLVDPTPTPAPDTSQGDQGVAPTDTAPTDTAPQPDDGPTPPPDVVDPPDEGPPQVNIATEPQAKVYLQDPLTESLKTTQVTLTRPTSADGSLTSAAVNAINCVNEDGGPSLDFGGFSVGTMCVEKHTIFPDPDGHYLSVLPPAQFDDGSDPFAELMMYHHVNTMNEYLVDTHGQAPLGFALDAIVNLQLNLNALAAGFLGMPPGWGGMPNAAFVPEEGFAQFGGLLPARPNGAIIFFQWNNLDFAYDSSVIYHEYTHAIVGTTRLNGVLMDTFGLNNLPGAMNEGFADYFAASIKDDPVIGHYALNLGAAGGDQSRDLSEARRCPDDLTTEVHADGKIIGSALWAMRVALGQLETDSIILDALQAFSQTTELTAAAALITAEAESRSAATGATVAAIMDDFGLSACDRAKEWTEWSQATSPDGLPISFEGTQAAQGGSFPDGVPGYLQFYVDVPFDAVAVELTFTAGAGGGGGFPGQGGGGAPDVWLALRHGQAVTVSPFSGSMVSNFNVEAPPIAGSNGGQKVVLAGDCIPQDSQLFIMMLNRAQSGGTITHLSSEIHTDPPIGETLEYCQGL